MKISTEMTIRVVLAYTNQKMAKMNKVSKCCENNEWKNERDD